MKTPLLGLGILFLLCGCTSWHYRTEGNQVFFAVRSSNHAPLDYLVKDADPSSFHALRDGYAADRSRVYFKGDLIPHADPTSFVILDQGYSKDAAHVFLGRAELPGADPKTWVRLGDYWSRDAHTVFHAHEVIHGARPESFRYLGQDWALDGRRAFHHLPSFTENGEPMKQLPLSVFEEVDPASFVVLGGFKAKDQYREYDALKKSSQATMEAPGN